MENEIFYYPSKNLPTIEQRKFAVELAEDILKNVLPDPIFDVSTGRYFITQDTQNSLYRTSDKYKNSFKNYLQSLKKSKKTKKNYCQVCALGCLLVSKTLLYNEVDIDKINNSSVHYFPEISPWIKLTQQIGVLNAQLIEHAFETKHITHRVMGGMYDNEIIKLNSLAIKSYETVNSARSRLMYIMKNVIKNDGVFVPKGCKLEKKK